MLRMIRVAILLAACGLLLPTASTQAMELLSNLPAVGSGIGTNLGLGTDLADRTKAVGLTMGATTMTFQSLEALISNDTPGSTLSGGIFSSVAGNPGALLSAFAPVAVAANSPVAEVSITTASSFDLMANTSYWFVLDGPSTTNSLLWQSLSPNVAPTPNGVSFDGYRFSSNGGSTWASSGIFNGVRVSAVPEPSGLVMLMASLGLLLVRARR